MRQDYHIIKIVPAVVFALVSVTSCIYDEESMPPVSDETIGVSVSEVNRSSGHRVGEISDNKFEVMFWLDEHVAGLGNPADGNGLGNPYLASEAPQSVAYYSHSVYDTGYPYPYPDTTRLYATGYAPSNIISATDNYATLTVNIPEDEKSQKTGRYDFLGCDFWRDVYNGSQTDHFAQEKNKLYFRHLAAKLVFYADRDKESMENKQFVRNVQIKNLRMKIGDAEWTESDRMHTPSVFVWSKLDPNQDFTASYAKVLADVKALPGNAGVTSSPSAGYRILQSEPFAGIGDYVLQRNPVDRVPIGGMVIDSCFVCNPIVDGVAGTGAIQLKMDISAELSYDFTFPASGDNGEDITFTYEWKDVTLDAINEVRVDADGNVHKVDPPVAVTEFRPGNEYRVYIQFNRTGVNLVAEELPWNYGGVHYININGGGNDE